MALESVEGYHLGPMFTPHFHRGNDIAPKGSISCPSATGGTNISGGAALDAQTGIMYVSSVKRCGSHCSIREGPDDGSEPDRPHHRRLAAWSETAFPNLNGLPILKPPYGRITAIDMNTGETLWWIPNGDTPDHQEPSAARRASICRTPASRHTPTRLVTGSLMIYGEGRGGRPYLHAVDKLTGETLASIELPASTSSQPITYMHEGVQYLLLSVAGGGHPASHSWR
jgi:glucose dehydrogenase